MFDDWDLILTFGSGEKLFRDKAFWVYAKSASRFPCHKTLLTDDIPEDSKKLLENHGFEIVIIDPLLNLLRDRHFAYWSFLKQNYSRYHRVFISDCRDVLIQKKPFDWCHENKVLLTSEGFKMSRSGFACIDNFEFEKNLPLHLRLQPKNELVINGGISLGSPMNLSRFHFMIWSIMSKSGNQCTDQAAFNWVGSFVKDDPLYRIVPPSQDFCLTGEGVREGVATAIIKNGMIMNDLGLPYCVIHQWDRIDALRDHILALHS